MSRLYMFLIAATLAVLSFARAGAQEPPDFDHEIRQSRYYDILRETALILKNDPGNAPAHFARAAALNSMYVFEEAQGHFEKARQNGISESATLGGNTFTEWNSANEASVQYLPLKASYPATREGFKVGVRGVTDSRHIRIAAAMLPSLAKQAEQFFGVKPDRLIIFIMPDGDASDEYWEKTKVTISAADMERGAYASKLTVVYFEKLNDSLSDRDIQETLAHEFAHVMHTLRNKEQALYGSKHPTWWVEGIATQFAASFVGLNRSQELQMWGAEMRKVGSIPFNGFITDFQENTRSRLHYRTASLMIRNILEGNGRATLLKIIDAVADEENYIEAPEALEKMTGSSVEQVFNAVVGQGRKTTGITDEGPQVKPDDRDFIPGDAVLAKDRNSNVFEPAMMLRQEGDTAYIRFYWGGQSRVPFATNIRTFDWKRGMQIRCKKREDQKEVATIEGLKYEGLIVKFSDGSMLELKYENCEDVR